MNQGKWARLVRALSVLTWAAAMTGTAGARAPLVGEGDIHFRLDGASFRSGNGTTEVELYVEIDNSELHFRPQDDGHQGRVRLRFELYAGSEEIQRWAEEAEVWVDDETIASSPIHTQVMQVRLQAEGGVDSVAAQVEDLNARKRGLLHLLSGSPRKGEAGLGLVPRRFPDGELSMSDLQFARAIVPAKSGDTFVKSGLDIEANAGRVYGLHRDRVTAYYETYDLRDSPDPDNRRYEISYELRDPQRSSARVWEKHLASAGAAWADTVGFSVRELDAGTYLLVVTVRDLDSEARAVMEGDFEVFWGSSNWVRWKEEQELLAPYFLDGPSLDTFLTLGVGARERFLRDFWASLDPGAEAEVNAVRAEFLRRVAYANERFSSALQAGLHTDQGRIYIKFGEPDEVRREVVPVQGNDLNAALRELDRESGSGSLSGARSIDDRDARAFEVWVYNHRGHELFKSTEQMSSAFGMMFVFVDDLGTDQNFRLIRSTERAEF